MTHVHARATDGPEARFRDIVIERRDPRPKDVLIAVEFSGICHSDLHHVANDYNKTVYPFVPGHEVAGVVTAVGSEVSKYKVGDRVGVGCMVDSCRECEACKAGWHQFCFKGYTNTQNGIDKDGNRVDGGYAESIVVDEDYVVRIPDSLPMAEAAPLMCAGATMWSVMTHWNVGPGKRVCVLGFGGVGHIGVQIAHKLGARVTVLDLSLDKQEDGFRLGADEYRSTLDPELFTELAKSFDLIVCTVPVNIDYDAYAGLLAYNGTLVLLAIPSKPLTMNVGSLIVNRRSVAGTLIAGIPETQAMLDFCGEHDVKAQVEIIDADYIDEAYDRVMKGDVKFRFVIDASTFDKS
jgi:uncharacterized zinc-type alcohol dehydrogenase-like protein